jgi:uncharacterized protein YacL
MLLVYVFNLNWIWILFFEFIFIGLIYVVFLLPSMMGMYVFEKIYKNSWVSVILHSLVGLLAYVWAFYGLYIGGFSISMFWEISKIKTFLLLLPGLSIIIGLFNSFVVIPIISKTQQS